jgi:acetamidase/formamidase
MRRFALILVCLLASFAVKGQQREAMPAPAAGVYQLKPTPKTVAWGYYDAATPPVLRIKSGDTVEVQTLITSSPARLEGAGVPAEAETPTHYITMGLHEDLTEATKMALREMTDFLVTEKHMTREEAYMLASVAADLDITQLVDGNKGVHAMIPKAIFVSPPRK